MRTLWIVATTAVVLLLTVTHPAAAGHTGQACHGKTSTDRSTLTLSEWMVANTSTTAAVDVVCPIQWSGSQSQTISSSSYITVYAIDNSYYQSISCSARALNTSGTAYYSATWYDRPNTFNSTGASTAIDTENGSWITTLSWPITSTGSTFSNGTMSYVNFSLQCSIPYFTGSSHSGIMSYAAFF